MVPDRYTFVRPLGAGGMGEVALVYDRERATKLALKKLKPDMVRPKDWERFRREARILHAMEHPNIIRIFDSHLDGDQPYFTMEYCEKGSIESLLSAVKSNEGSVIGIFKQILSGLSYIHSPPHDTLHRDLKPGNVLVGNDGLCKISDFGLGRQQGDATITSSNWGSAGFTAPEQFTGMHEVDLRADLYSAGAVGYYLLTGLVPNPFSDLRFSSSINCKILEPIIRRLLSNSPKARANSAEIVLKAVSRLEVLTNEARVNDVSIADCKVCGEWSTYKDEVSKYLYWERCCLVCGHKDEDYHSAR